MRKIVLVCSAGVSTSLLVKKMNEEAEKLGYDCKISFYPLSEIAEAVQEADAVLLAPQAAHELGEIQVKYPDAHVDVIPQAAYGAADAAAVLDLAQRTAGDY